MILETSTLKDKLIVTADGRLDASWSEYFQDFVLKQIRNGDHQIVIDASKLTFLSSIGIRALLIVHKKLSEVGGSLEIANATEMISSVLDLSGFGQWLSDEKLNTDDSSKDQSCDNPDGIEVYKKAGGGLNVSCINAWEPWETVREDQVEQVEFSTECFGFGIGGAGGDYKSAAEYLGEFITVGGHVALQPPDEQSPPDYLLQEKQFSPSLHCVQAVVCREGFDYNMRFKASENSPFYTVSSLLQRMMESSKSDNIVWAVIGEVEGLVGAHLIQSPAHLKGDSKVAFPEIKEWLSYCGERRNAGDLAIITGTAERSSEGSIVSHAHAAVFPYQFLPNGELNLFEVSDKIFRNSPPKAVMHLLNDDRKVNGIGESALLNGSAWFGTITDDKETGK